MRDPRVVYSLRIHPSTLNDIKKLAKIMGNTQADTVRFLLNRGFNAIGNWRRSHTIIINGKKTLVDSRT